MYIRDLETGKELVQGVRDALDDLLAWDANNDDQLNPEVIELDNKLKEIKEKIKTL